MYWVQLASILMFLAVALGAFGAHALKDRLIDHGLETYKTAVLYHFIHALALFVIAWLRSQTHDPKIQAAGVFFLLGIMLFCGSLYVLSITQIKWFGALTPLGGLCLLTGWALLAMGKY